MKLVFIQEMKLSNSVIILEIFFLILITGSVPETTEDYVTLISDVYKVSNSSAVSLLYLGENENLFLNGLIFNIRFLLSNKKISTSTVNLEKAFSLNQEKFIDFRKLRKDTKAMSVFFLQSGRDLTKMQEVSRFLSRNEIINLVLFLKSDETRLEEICMNPEGNPFFLNVGISLLVKCSDDIFVREWHSLDENKMGVYERATWESETGLILKTEKLILSDSDVLKGKVLLSASPRLIGKVTGRIMEDLFHALEQAGNFTIKKYEEMAGIKIPKRGNLALKLVADKKVHLASALYSLTVKRSSVIDYSGIVQNMDLSLIFRQPKRKVVMSWSGFCQSFSSGVWIALFFSIIFIQALRVLLKRKLQKDLHDEEYVVDDFIYIFGIYFQQGLPVFPKASSLRIFYLTIFLFTFCMFSIYSAGFVSKLSIMDSNLPFNSLEELVELKSHKILVPYDIVIDKLKNSKHRLWREAGDLAYKLSKNVKPIMDMICQDNVVLFASETWIPDLYYQSTTRCPLVKIKSSIYDPSAMIFPKNGPYTRALNNILKKLSSAGILKRLISTVLEQESIKFVVAEDVKNTYSPVKGLDLAVLFIILSGGIFTSVVILIYENLHFLLFETKTIQGSSIFRKNKMEPEVLE